METAYGQLYKRTLHTYFDSINSKFIGISFATVIIVFCTAIYYNTLIAWSCGFFLYSFQSDLPWAIHSSEDLADINYWRKRYFREEFLKISENLFDFAQYVPIVMISFVIVSLLCYLMVFKSLQSASIAVYGVMPL